MWDVGCGVWGVYVEGGGVVCSGSGVYSIGTREMGRKRICG